MNQTIALPRPTGFSRSLLNKLMIWITIWIIIPLIIYYFLAGAIAAEILTKPVRTYTNGYTPAIVQLQYEDIQFPSRDGEATISAWYMPSAQKAQAIILVHGRNASRTDLFQGHALDLASTLNQSGFSVLMIDLRGHGQSSDGRFTYGLKERYDVLGAVDWLVTRGYEPGKIGVMGISLGSAAAIGAAADDPRIGALLSDSGFADMDPMIRSRWTVESRLPMAFFYSTRLMIWLKYGYDVTASKPVAEIGKVAPRPVMLVHCTDDAMIPYSNVEQLKAAVPDAQLWSIPTCLHGSSYNADPAAYEQHMIDFFRASLP